GHLQRRLEARRRGGRLGGRRLSGLRDQGGGVRAGGQDDRAVLVFLGRGGRWHVVSGQRGGEQGFAQLGHVLQPLIGVHGQALVDGGQEGRRITACSSTGHRR